jgi:hypothetical protein
MNPNGPPYHGQSKGDNASLQGAIEDAWKKAKDKHADPGWYAVGEIKVLTVNPIRGYSVEINPTTAPPDS